MKENLGSFDIGARFVLGCVLLFLGLNGLGYWGLLGLIPLFTCMIGFCPLYWLLHLDTAKWEERWEARHPHHPIDPHHLG